ncbi:FBX42 protein, partial [Chaetorhynchus papuensis]|nr:FBX42 protein [Chaetorhynchus papuensis]
MASSSDSDDDGFMAVDPEDAVVEGTMEQEEEPHAELEPEEPRHNRSMLELPEEVLEYILSFLSPYQEHKTAALVCKQWYRLIKGTDVVLCLRCAFSLLLITVTQIGRSFLPRLPVLILPFFLFFFFFSFFFLLFSFLFGKVESPRCDAFGKRRCRVGGWCSNVVFVTFPPSLPGSYPSPKAGATLVVYKDLLVLFGGWTRPSPYPLHQPERFFDEIHTYSPSKNWWNCIMTTHGPPPMAGHSSCVIEDKMIVFGGSLGSRQMSNDVWVLDLEQWAWSKPSISGPSPHPRGGQSQIVIDNETILILGGCGGPNALFKDAWLLHMQANPWTWQPLKVENEDHGAPELWCHPACRVGQCVVVFSQAPSGRAPLSPSLNSRPSPISATPPALVPETREFRSQSPVRNTDEAPCVNGRWGTLRPRRQTPSGSREGSLSPARGDSSPVLNGGTVSPGAAPAGGASLDSPVQVLSPSTPSAAEGFDLKVGLALAPRRGSLPEQRDLRLASVELGWEQKPTSLLCQLDGAEGRTAGTRNPPEHTNGVHTPPHAAAALPGAVSPGALRRSLEAVKALSSKAASASAALSPPLASSPGSPGAEPGSARAGAAQGEGHSLPPIARRLGHHPPQSLNVGKPLYQSMNCKPMQMYVLDIKDTKEQGRVKWKVFNSSSVVGPPETSLHTVVQGRGELIIFGGLMDKKQNVKYYPKTNALYFVRAKR